MLIDDRLYTMILISGLILDPLVVSEASFTEHPDRAVEEEAPPAIVSGFFDERVRKGDHRQARQGVSGNGGVRQATRIS